jgi:hypothetical protein
LVTTEHFTLQGARTAAITESTSWATIFIGSVSAGLVALGLIAGAGEADLISIAVVREDDAADGHGRAGIWPLRDRRAYVGVPARHHHYPRRHGPAAAATGTTILISALRGPDAADEGPTACCARDAGLSPASLGARGQQGRKPTVLPA